MSSNPESAESKTGRDYFLTSSISAWLKTAERARCLFCLKEDSQQYRTKCIYNEFACGGSRLNLVSHRKDRTLLQQVPPWSARILLNCLKFSVACLYAVISASLPAQQLTVKPRAIHVRELNFMIRSWQLQNGLPEASIQAFAQTPDGYLWIGTTGGLLRFDGASFRLFNHTNTSAFGEDDVFSLLADRNGDLWIGTSGAGLIEWKNGVFRPFPTVKGQNIAYVRALVEDSSGQLWVATDGGVFWVKGYHLARVRTALGTDITNAHAVLEDRIGRIWIGGSRLFSFRNGRFREYPLPGKDNRYQVKSLATTADGTIWVGTVSGLYRLLPGADRLVLMPRVFGLVRTLRVIPSGELWAGTIGAGIFRIRGNDVTRLQAPSTLSNTVYSIFVDTGKNLWIGTLTGIMCLSQTPVQVLALPEAAGADFGTVALDKHGSLWFASNQLMYVRGDVARPVRFPELGSVRVRNILRSRDGSLWIGTIGGGIYHISAEIEQHFTTRAGLSSNFVQALLEARDSTIWIGTNNGVSHLDSSGLHNLRTQNGLSANDIRSLIEDRAGTIWIGSERGLALYTNGAFVYDALTLKLENERIWALYQDADDGIWIGTHGDGLFYYRDGLLSHYTIADGLPSDTIYCILGDSRNHLWVSSPSGVMLLDRSELSHHVRKAGSPISLRYYEVSERNAPVQVLGGMQSSGALTATGAAWFPTTEGLWKISPDDAIHPKLFNLNIDSVTVDGQRQSLTQKLRLKADSNHVDIAYQPVLLAPQENLAFRYKLQGLDKRWTYANAQQRLATYTNLPPGKFTFLVESWERGDPQHVVRASIAIVKLRHFYQMPWFIALCALGILLLSFFGYQVRMQQINGRFTAVLAERTRLAREMHDTLIQGCIAVSALLKAAASDEVDDNESRMHLIDYAATQIHTTIDEARQAVWNLRGEEHVSVELPVALRRMAERVSHEHGLKITSHSHGRPFPISLQAGHEVMMVARESVFNAILHGHAHEIDVELGYMTDTLSLTVKDTGLGFEASNAFIEGHFGLRGMRERIHRFHGKFEIESTPRQGTRIGVEIPRADIAP
ncbi:MAG: two-component regulator propeller domain-containing protein [Acidobacteriota bacterium]